VSTVKDPAVKATLYLRVQMSLCGYCPHLLSDLGELLSEREEHNATVHSPSMEISTDEDLTFLMSTN